MNIRELKALIAILPEEMDVCIRQEHTEFSVSNVEMAGVIKASYSEEPGGKVLARYKVFLLTDEI